MPGILIAHHTIQIELSDALYAELLDAIRECGDDQPTPEAFCTECVENVLASR